MFADQQILNNESLPTEVKQALQKYERVLWKPKGLPPTRVLNHGVILLPGQSTVLVQIDFQTSKKKRHTNRERQKR